MNSDRKKPAVTFSATVALVVVLVGYPLSIGPAEWLLFKLGKPKWLMSTIGFTYAPLDRAAGRCPERLKEMYLSYLGWWIDLGRK